MKTKLSCLLGCFFDLKLGYTRYLQVILTIVERVVQFLLYFLHTIGKVYQYRAEILKCTKRIHLKIHQIVASIANMLHVILSGAASRSNLSAIFAFRNSNSFINTLCWFLTSSCSLFTCLKSLIISRLRLSKRLSIIYKHYY